MDGLLVLSYPSGLLRLLRAVEGDLAVESLLRAVSRPIEVLLYTFLSFHNVLTGDLDPSLQHLERLTNTIFQPGQHAHGLVGAVLEPIQALVEVAAHLVDVHVLELVLGFEGVQ